jgi:F0F1-type ATP synthase assembly protein I
VSSGLCRVPKRKNQTDDVEKQKKQKKQKQKKQKQKKQKKQNFKPLSLKLLQFIFSKLIGQTII